MNAVEPQITPLIRTIRDQRVILDADLAALYGVPTKRFNEAFKRNRDRFPEEFTFQLSAGEFTGLNWSQTATSHGQDTDIATITSNSSQLAMSSRKHRGATYRPWAFTEHGALMAANILRSPRAREMSVCVLPLKTKPLKGGTRCPHRVLVRTLSNQPVGDPAFAQAYGGHRNGLHLGLN